MEKPLIFEFCTSRRNEDGKPNYKYDIDKNLNMINLYGKDVPFVNYEINGVVLEMDTITEVTGEEDSTSMQGLFETETITRVMREESDIHDINISFLELITKTDTVRESDDE